MTHEQLYRFTHNAFTSLTANFEKNIKYYQDSSANFVDLLKKYKINDYKEVVNGVYITKPIYLKPPIEAPTHLADLQSLDFYNSFSGMTPRIATDPRVLAYLNHIYLHKYGIARWPKPKPENIRKHWLTGSKENTTIWKSSISGRTWWIAHVANQSADASAGAFNAIDVLKMFSETPEYFHRIMEYGIFKNRILMAEIIRSLLNEAHGINRNGFISMARRINLEAGPRLIDSLDRFSIRNMIEKIATNKMSVPEFVKDRKNLLNKKKLKVLSLGAGAQSTTLALMAEEGWNGLEKPDLAIFADTQWEPPEVYKHLDWLEKQLSYDVIRVSAGNIKENIMKGVNSDGDKFLDIPAFLINSDGSKSTAARQCTTHYKINPIHKEIRRRLKIPYGKRVPKDIQVEMWIGISADESIRIKPSRNEWIDNRYPLVEMDMTRANVYNWFAERYPERHLPTSACVGCPYHGDMAWKWIKEHEPASFREAVKVDWALRNIKDVRGSLRGEAYLHHSRVPLDKVDLSSTMDYDGFMASECEGLCGV
ncbi:MAG: DUF6339 family protein [Pirellulales bacterium]|nr:DUF6339 family protein [Pirellulales bacterium]